MNFKVSWLAVIVLLALAACGGGGGGGDGGTTDPVPGGPGGPNAAARTGRITFAELDSSAKAEKLKFLDLATKAEDSYTVLKDLSSGCDRSNDRWIYEGHSATVNGQVLVASNCDLLQKNSKIVIYNADRTIADTRYFNTIRIFGPPKVSPNGRYIFVTLRDILLGLNVPDKFQNILIDRNNNNAEFSINFQNSDAVWVSDDVLLFQVTGGFKTWKVGDAQPGDLIPNTQGGYLPTVSPDGKKIAFLTAPNPQAIGDVYMVNIDGSNKRQVTKTGVADERPAFSPGGTELMLIKGLCYVPIFGKNPQPVHIIPADSTMLDVPDSQPGKPDTSPYLLSRKDGTKLCVNSGFYKGSTTWK